MNLYWTNSSHSQQASWLTEISGSSSEQQSAIILATLKLICPVGNFCKCMKIEAEQPEYFRGKSKTDFHHEVWYILNIFLKLCDKYKLSRWHNNVRYLLRSYLLTQVSYLSYNIHCITAVNTQQCIWGWKILCEKTHHLLLFEWHYRRTTLPSSDRKSFSIYFVVVVLKINISRNKWAWGWVPQNV